MEINRFALNHIESIPDVVEFFEYLMNDRKVSFNPDDDFADYVDIVTGQPTFSDDEIVRFNRMMNEAFEVCERERIEIYSIGLATMRRLIDPTICDPLNEGDLVRKKGENTLFKVLTLDDKNCQIMSFCSGEKCWLETCDVEAV